ncbi:hypothetical protein ACFVZJ_39790 [Streptomyces sp. NPDC058322]|uniref:hypothetical protein n=1 Tax=unclassified Streptomyces TaxID=2593676 RepID=UPI0036E81D0C
MERAKQYEAMAARYVKKAIAGDAGAAQMAQTFASLAAAARMERLDWRMRVLGDQLGNVKKAMDRLRLKLPVGRRPRTEWPGRAWACTHVLSAEVCWSYACGVDAWASR